MFWGSACTTSPEFSDIHGYTRLPFSGWAVIDQHAEIDQYAGSVLFLFINSEQEKPCALRVFCLEDKI